MKWILLNKVPVNELTPHLVFELKDHSEIWPVLQIPENWLLPIWKYLLCKLDWYAAIFKITSTQFLSSGIKGVPGDTERENLSVCLSW